MLLKGSEPTSYKEAISFLENRFPELKKEGRLANKETAPGEEWAKQDVALDWSVKTKHTTWPEGYKSWKECVEDTVESLLDMETLFNLQKVNVAVKDKPDAKPLLLNSGEIRFENVTFGYRPDRPILKNLNLTIPAGKKVAVVGPSGCGKSTILRLLFRYYDVQEGRILIDGQDIRDVSQESLRKAIGVVPQDPVLFNSSISYNIGSVSAFHTGASILRVMSDMVNSRRHGKRSKRQPGLRRCTIVS